MTTIQNPVQADIMDISSKHTSTSEQFRQLLKDIPTPEVYSKLDVSAYLTLPLIMLRINLLCRILLNYCGTYRWHCEILYVKFYCEILRIYLKSI